MHSVQLEAWKFFDVPAPKSWPELPKTNTGWSHLCDAREPFELETGAIVLDKQRVWPALMLTAFINTHHHFFQRRRFGGDKQTFAFGFNATHTPYAVSRKHPLSVGRVARLETGELYFCGNTLAQRHPITGEVMFMHRGGAKYSGPVEYLRHSPPPRAWSVHMACIASKSK